MSKKYISYFILFILFAASCSKEESIMDENIIRISSLSVATGSDWLSTFTRSNTVEEIPLNDGYRGIIKDGFVEGDQLSIAIQQAPNNSGISTYTHYFAKLQGNKWQLYSESTFENAINYITIDRNNDISLNIRYGSDSNNPELYFYATISSDGIGKGAIKGDITESSASSLSVVMDHMRNFVDVKVTVPEDIDIEYAALVTNNFNTHFQLKKVENIENRYQYAHPIGGSSITIPWLYFRDKNQKEYWVTITSKDEFGNKGIEITGSKRFKEGVSTSDRNNYPDAVCFCFDVDLTNF